MSIGMGMPLLRLAEANMNILFDTKKAKIIVKSPIHIGSVGQKLTPFEYIRDSQNVYRINDDRMSLLLKQNKLINSYLSAFSRDGHRFRLMDFLRSNGLSLKVEDLIYLSSGRKSKVLGNLPLSQDYRPFIRDGFGNIYLPGTSIKGVVRTSILYNVLKIFHGDNPEKFKEIIVDRISKDIDSKVQKKKLFEWGIKRWLQGYELQEKNESPNTDWLRLLHVSDAYPTNKVETVIIPVKVLKKELNGWEYKKGISGQEIIIWVECIPDDTEFEFDILWDKRLHEEFKSKDKTIVLPHNLNEICLNIDRWAKGIIEYESGKDGFVKGHDIETWYKDHSANFRIGFGSGMSSTTIAMLLPDDLRKKVRNFSGQNRGNAVAPKSRKVWINENKSIPLGWARLEVKDFNEAV